MTKLLEKTTNTSYTMEQDRLPKSTRASFNLQSKLDQFRQQEQKLSWSGSFGEYFDMALENPRLTRLSHARVYDMIMDAGVEVGKDGKSNYKFFENEVFGIEDSLRQIVDYFSSAAKRLEVRKRILLEMGPVGGGKSTIVTLLKRGMERYSRTDAGAVYALDECPMHEEPMHLIPEEMRADLHREHGIHVEGDLCPRCNFKLQKELDGDIMQFPVRRIAFSEKNRVGIGTFSPSDPKSQDITELTGSIDLSTIGEYGTESDPRAYRFDGELNVSNRGVMEFVEMLKCDEKFLYGLLTLTQEQSIKTGRFSMIYADEVILSHSNEAEYQSFAQNKKSEALQDRIITVRVPYNLRVSDEEKIYQKLLRDSNLHVGKDLSRGEVHIAPQTLRTAATFAVLSRLEASKKSGMTPMKKLRLYDGDMVEGFNERDVKELKEETVREGMDGISPRYIINRISNSLSQESVNCINPIDVLRSIRDGFDQSTNVGNVQDRDKLANLIAETRREYDDVAKREIQRAFVYSFEDSAKTLFNNYLDNIEAYCNKGKIKDPITDEMVEPDERIMRSLEDQIGVSENAKRAFREEILIRLSTLARKGQTFDYNSHERLKEAVEKKLFSDMKDIVKITTSTKTPDVEQLRRMNEVVDRLIGEHDYCGTCSNELLKYVGTLLSR